MAIKDFKEGKDIPEKMGIGLKNKVEEWLEEHNITASKIESEIVNGYKVFFVDVDGDVWLDGYNLDDVSKIPNYIKFRDVKGKFILANNK
jgi:hypothetical protein